MGISDCFKSKEYKAQIEMLTEEARQDKARIAELEALITPDLDSATAIKQHLERLQSELTAKQAELLTIDETILNKKAEFKELNREYREKKKQLSVTEEQLELEDFGLYSPRFKFTTVDEYKERLEQIRDIQKAMVSNDTACSFSENWTVDGSLSKGKKMTKGNVKMVLRCFNCECDNAVAAVKFSNYDRMVSRIEKAFNLLNALSETVKVSITEQYLKLKLDELTLAYEYERAKQEEKERIRELKEQEREQRVLEKEIEAERKRLQKEQNHYENALGKVLKQLENNPQDPDLLQKKEEIENHIADAEKAMQEVDYREANRRAGYVYVISNIGAFGEGVYKIGMTRRLDPQERVDELGDASVPFRFDVHAMIFSDDAPALENALHKAFENRRLNKVNLRREFFKVSLDEIKAVVKANYSKTAEFIEIPEAEQYRTSLKM